MLMNIHFKINYNRICIFLWIFIIKININYYANNNSFKGHYTSVINI